MKTIYLCGLVAALTACKSNSNDKKNPEPASTNQKTEVKQTPVPKEETSTQSSTQTSNQGKPQVIPATPPATTQPTITPWSKLTDYKLVALVDSDYKLASREIYSLNHQLFFQNGQIQLNREAMSKEKGQVACEVEFSQTMLKSRRALKKGQETLFSKADIRLSSVLPTFGYSFGKASAANGTRVKSITCIKYSKDALTIEDLKASMGLFVQIAPR
jgi:hypothetical protein